MWRKIQQKKCLQFFFDLKFKIKRDTLSIALKSTTTKWLRMRYYYQFWENRRWYILTRIVLAEWDQRHKIYRLSTLLWSRKMYNLLILMQHIAWKKILVTWFSVLYYCIVTESDGNSSVKSEQTFTANQVKHFILDF